MEWLGEGTAIEPSQEYEYQQLEICTRISRDSLNPGSLALTVELYQKKKEHKNKLLENKN